MRKFYVFLFFVAIVSCNSFKGKKELQDKEEIKELLIKSSEWFWSKIDIRYDYDEMTPEELKDSVTAYINETEYFSESYKKVLFERKEKTFGNYFCDCVGYGDALGRLCNKSDKYLEYEIHKVSDNKYRYITPLQNVLYQFIDPNTDPKYDERKCLYENMGEGNDRCQFSVVIIKENDRWVIDNVEMIQAKLLDIYYV